MKIVECKEAARPPRNVMVCDWKDGPDEVLELVDEQLAAHGLEIEVFNMEDDQYYWRIVPRGR